jgi:hypothetical protein
MGVQVQLRTPVLSLAQVPMMELLLESLREQLVQSESWE